VWCNCVGPYTRYTVGIIASTYIMKKALVLLVSLLTITSSAHALRVLPPTDDIPDTGSSLYCPQLSQTLKRGMRDASTYPTGQVSELQNFLADYFDVNEQDVISGFFGRNTQRYVMNFQQKYGLPAYGIVGTLTRVKIAEVCTNQTVQPPTCNNYPKPTCAPNQKLVEEWNDYRGCPTVGRCVDIVSTGKPSISISTPQTSYITGEPVLVTTKATRTLGSDYGAATPAEGYKVLVTVSYPEGAYITNFNPIYNASTGYWEGSYVPSYNGGAHAIRTELYCTNKSLPCGSYIGFTTDQVIASAQTTIRITQASSIPTCTITTDKASYQLNDTINLSWTSSRASFAQFMPDTSGKDNLQVPGDKLPAQGTQQIRATVYGNPYVTMKVVGPEGQSALCQKTIPVTYTNSGPLTVQASLADPKGLGRESFPFGEQLVIKWNVSDPSDVETAGWGIYGKSETGIELRPVDSPTAAGTRIIRVAETGVFPHTFTWNVTQEGLYGDRVAPGRYYIYVNVPSKKQGGYVTGVAGPIGIGDTTASASLKVITPNGGEIIVANESTQLPIRWKMQGITTPLSIALYRNDQWVQWIDREVYLDKSFDDTYTYLWVPNAKGPTLPPLTAGVNENYKIYITGKKADGTGYLDDKSDTPFSFSSSMIPDSISLTQPAASTFYTLGQQIPISWNIPVPNAHQKTQVLVELKGISTTGGNGGGIWQSSEIATTPGQTNGTYAWPTGGYGGLSATGTYAITVYWVDCEPQGCTYNYDQQGGLGRRRYAQSNPVYITINPAVSQGGAGSSAGGVSGTTINPYDLLWSFSPLRIFGN
jgi:peptidoglycan hydrolase-like protein with peptidoglycan-binding domain